MDKQHFVFDLLADWFYLPPMYIFFPCKMTEAQHFIPYAADVEDYVGKFFDILQLFDDTFLISELIGDDV